MPRIFISYRRADSQTMTGRIHEHLSRAYGKENVFMDVQDIPAGIHFQQHLANQIELSDVMLVIIGNQWLENTDGVRRLDDPDDMVRFEIARGLERQDMRVIPVLIQDAPMPSRDDLPEPLRQLHFHNAMKVRDEPDFPIDMQRLIGQIGTPQRNWRIWLAGVVVAFVALAIIAFLVLQNGDDSGAEDSADSSTSPAASTSTMSVPTSTLSPTATRPASVSSTTAQPDTSTLNVTVIDLPTQRISLPENTTLYELPDITSAELRTLNVGKAITIRGQDETGEWLYVDYTFGETVTGWVTGDWVQTYTHPPVTDVQTIENTQWIASEPEDGFWRVIFVQPLEGQDNNEGADTLLVDHIDLATQSIDLSTFDFDLVSVQEALLRAQARGVTVRVIAEEEYMEEEESAIPGLVEAGIPVVSDNRSGLMHQNFVIIDGNAVWTGKWGYTQNATVKNNNSILIFYSPDVVARFQERFDYLFNTQEFGPNGTPSSITQLTVNDQELEIYFTPVDDALTPVEETLRNAQDSIYIMMYSFSFDDIAQILIEKMEQGLDVQVVVESRVDRYIAPWVCDGANFRSDGNPYLLHHGVIIVDDKIVISGSYNISLSAFENNDEYVIITHDPKLADVYMAEFERVLDESSPISADEFECE